jgi:hypothetical protein
MARIRRELIFATPSRMKPSERLAWAINAYNFLVIDLVTTHLVDANISKYRLNEGYTGVLRSTVQQIRIEGQPFFEAPVVEIEDRVFSLNEFERTFVFGGYPLKAGTPPPPALDPRAHFALVCAARGCPPLQPRAFHPDSLDLQLERATRQALQQPAHLRLEPETGVLYGSSVFNWYAADFGGEDGAYAFAERHAPESLRRLLAARPKRRFDQFITWDWKLNDAPRPATGPPSSARDSN